MRSFKTVQIMGLILVLAGAQAAVAIPLQMRIWYPPPTALLANVSGIGGSFQGESTPPPGYSAHWYQGSVAPWYLFPPTATQLSVSITTPSGAPGSSEFYYVLLSCWNDIGSYCQIGFAAVNGHWGLTWCWTEWSGDTIIYHYSADAKTLAQGTSYTFYMTIEYDGDLRFALYQGRPLIWSKTVSMDANYFILNNYYWRGLTAYYCFTDYEEVYYTDAETPDFNFKFRYTSEDGYYWDNWYVLDVGSPTDCTTLISTTSHYVWVINPDAS